MEDAKRKAALEAVKHVKNGFVIGLGSGSTAAYAIEALGERIKRERLSILGIPTSYQAFLLAVKHGITVTTLEEQSEINLAIDGADQIDAKLNLIKGMGGALAREKIVATASKHNIIIADESKKVRVLGENGHPVPVEVLPFALSIVKHNIEALGGTPVLREAKGKVGPVITDNGNAVIDASFGIIGNVAKLERKLKMIPGVLETGLFVSLAHIAYIGTPAKVEKIKRRT
ncbi:MAG: ribose-5-phosphate isomerase RpiA [Candidatus Bathyarchaeota archaeon]|nr:MAG: ribose-5-phosphate isomerase RpiA [Candidatus Bathyarchaeota archaeon]